MIPLVISALRTYPRPGNFGPFHGPGLTFPGILVEPTKNLSDGVRRTRNSRCG